MHLHILLSLYIREVDDDGQRGEAEKKRTISCVYYCILLVVHSFTLHIVKTESEAHSDACVIIIPCKCFSHGNSSLVVVNPSLLQQNKSYHTLTKHFMHASSGSPLMLNICLVYYLWFIDVLK